MFLYNDVHRSEVSRVTKPIATAIAAILLGLVSISPAGAQAVNATLLGTVTDVSGAAIPRAKIIITESKTGVSHTGSANDSGNYTFPDLPPGLYNVTVEVAGFKKDTRNNIIVDVNSSVRIDMQLQPGNISETVEVKATAAVLQTDRTDTGHMIEGQLVEDLPLGVNRNFQSLLELAPGVSESTFQHSQFFNAASSLQHNSNGQPRQGNNSQIEGIDNNQRTGLLQILIPPAEAIQMVSISTSNHEPELGRGTGAISNVVIKSGTNLIHGQAYELTQNSAFDARSFFNKTVGHLAYNRAGFNLGGPIKRNKIFIFGDYLRTMDHEANTNTVTIPSLPFRSGDLSADTRNKVYDPTSGDPVTGANRTPFPDNQIPLSRIDPIALKILSYLPAPNQSFNPAAPSNNYFALLPAQKTTDALDVKVDWNISDKDRLSGRFSFAHPVTFQAPIFGDAGGPAQGAFQGSGFQKTYSSGLNYNRTLGPTLLTEVRIGVAHYHNESQPSDYGKDDTTKLGIPGVNVNQFTSGFVGISIPNFSSPMTGYSASLPWIRAEANIDIANNWTKLLRNHALKFGVDVRRVRDDLLQDQTFSPRGVITFGTNQTSTPGNTGTGLANDMASFLLGLPSSMGRDVNTYFPGLRAWQVFGYAADNWNVSGKLTLNLGLRWEFYPPATPSHAGGFSNYDMANNRLIIAGVGGNPSNLGMVTHYKYFAPRLGIAYRLTPSTVLRTGFGISYTPYPDNNYAYNFPVRSNNNYTTGTTSYLPAVDPLTGAFISLKTGFPALRPVEVPANGIITNPDINSTYYILPTDFKNPYVESWNFAVQQALPFHLVLDLAYVGSHGVNIAAAPNLNAGQVIGAGSRGQPQYPRTAATNLIFQGFSSSYHSLQGKLDRRFSSGLRMTTSFTWQKALAVMTGDDGGLWNYVASERSYARADYDRTLNFVQSYMYDMPFGRGKRWMPSSFTGKILGGWRMNGILSARSGKPFNIAANGGSLNLPSSNQTADQIAPVEILHGVGVGNPWFSTTSFAQPVGARFGTLGRNRLDGPGLFSLNASLIREFTLFRRESGPVKLDVRAESLNVTNTAEFSNPQGNLTNATYGYVTGTLASGTGVNGTGGGRAIQFGAKLTF